MNKKLLRFIPAIAAIIIAGVVFLCSGNGYDAVKVKEPLPDERERLPEETSSTPITRQDGIWIYVSGCVQYPGVYFLPENARVFEAIDMAGGMTADAAKDQLNLAMELEDGQHIYVNGKDETGVLYNGNAAAFDENDGMININCASEQELMSLPGIGASKAKAIIEYRKHDRFECIEDIMNVSGIKEGSFEKIKDRIKV